MSLLKDFYKRLDIKELGNSVYQVKIKLNKTHNIFKGHFPNNPVTPGVCMMQIIKESVESISQKKLQLAKLTNVKFMAIINPEKNDELSLNIEINETEDLLKVKNTTSFDETVALKFSGEFKFV